MLPCLAGLTGLSATAAVRASELRVESGAQRVEVLAGGGRVVVDDDRSRRGRVQAHGEDGDVLVDLGAQIADDRIQVDLAGDLLFEHDSAALAPSVAQRPARVAQRIRTRSVGQVHIGCIESMLEELDFDFDADARNELEDAMALGSDNKGGRLCRACQPGEGFGERECAAVEKRCFGAH
ncbi:MAG: hypothetical protein DYH17_05680 [Xanthomonadales bacterium PRO6]|nr:hypothetical protein [Xanthomonadales bacterium PRO6]